MKHHMENWGMDLAGGTHYHGTCPGCGLPNHETTDCLCEKCEEESETVICEGCRERFPREMITAGKCEECFFEGSERFVQSFQKKAEIISIVNQIMKVC
jgi:hypothetical protein